MAFKVPEKYRITSGMGRWNSTAADGNNGAFAVRLKPGGEVIKVIASDGEGWEHVSVSLSNRTPTWAEMCAIKDLFWDPEDCTIQYHVPKSDWVSIHAHCLHIWRPVGVEIPRPPRDFV